ncbi:MAG: PD-(D/E)XK nuclease family protein, partial [Planctomycetaceae bacterium]|nr:PD-(D/E)XK nuclease family protein [Planctomycetaceae bacterium]
RRWEALQQAQQEYLSLLDGLGLWDKQTARIVAERQRECRTEHDIILVGTVDLNRSTRRMLDQVADRVTALIHAPEALSGRFDKHGCLLPDAWLTADVPLAHEQVRIVDKPQDQADEVVRALANLKGRYRADEITIGLADESLALQIERRLRQYNAPARWVIGRSLSQTGVVRLLEATADYLETEQSDQFAALVRHPDVFRWLCQQGVDPAFLTELDDYLSRHLQRKLGFWLESPSPCRQVHRAYKLVTRLLSPFHNASRPLADWSDVIVTWLNNLQGDQSFDPQVPAEKMELDATVLLLETLDAHAEVPDALLPVVSGAQALWLTLDEISQSNVPAPPDESAIEILGRLELPLDDAPVVVITSFNEGNWPSASGADLFLPDRLRQRLGVEDNDRRYARDAYALCALLASRKQVVLVAGRRDTQGDPLLPSRLLFACDANEAAQRVQTYFESPAPPPLPVFGTEAAGSETSRFVVPLPQPLTAPIESLRVTAFRSYIACPYRFYLEQVLGLQSVSDDADEMDGAAFGTLVHEVLKKFGQSDLRNAPAADQIEHFLSEAVDDAADRLFGRARWPAVSVQIEQARRRLRAFAPWQAHRAQDGWTIQFVECAGEEQPTQLTLPDGRSITLKGRIDRIDRREPTGEWALLDYKTSDAANSPQASHRKKDA